MTILITRIEEFLSGDQCTLSGHQPSEVEMPHSTVQHVCSIQGSEAKDLNQGSAHGCQTQPPPDEQDASNQTIFDNFGDSSRNSVKILSR